MALASGARAAGWILAASLLVGSLIYLDLTLNLFNWDGELNRTTVVCIVLLAAALFLTRFTAKRTPDVFSHFASLFIPLGLAVLAVYTVTPEPLGSGLSFLGRRTVSPVWYRASRSCILIVPLLLWLWFPMRSRRMKLKSSPRNKR